MAASLSFRRRSRASCSRRALVLELPLGATPVKIFLLSLGVKFTKDTDRDLLDPFVEPLLPGVRAGLGIVELIDILLS